MQVGSEGRTEARLGVMFLLILTGLLLVLRPGQFASESAFLQLYVLTSLAACYALFLSEWKNHGFIFGMIAGFAFLLADRARPKSWQEASWNVNQMLFLTSLAVHLIVCPQSHMKTRSVTFWIVATFSMSIVSTLVWIEESKSSEYLSTYANDHWWALNQRLRNCSFLLIVLGGVFSSITAKHRPAQIWLWLAACLAAPFVGFEAASFFVPVRFNLFLTGARWPQLPGDFYQWFSRQDLALVLDGWCWTTPWLVIPLMGIGLWRMLGRGLRQRKMGNLPIAWLNLFAAGLLFAALVPASSASEAPVGLIWLGIALSAFAVADMLYLLYEQLALPVPPTGPSNVPHV